MEDFKTPIGTCNQCGQTEYLVPYFGDFRRQCGCDISVRTSDGTSGPSMGPEAVGLSTRSIRTERE